MKLTSRQKRIVTMLSNLYTPGDIPWPPAGENPYMEELYPPYFAPRWGCCRRRAGPFGPYPFQQMGFGQGPYEGE